MINLPDAVMLGAAYDRRSDSPVGLQGFMIFCTWLWVSSSQQQHWHRLFVLTAKVAT